MLNNVVSQVFKAKLLPPVDVPQVPFLDKNDIHGLPDDGNTSGCTKLPDDSAENVLRISWLADPDLCSRVRFPWDLPNAC